MSRTPFRAALVDLDGLLAETEHLGQEALVEVWQEAGEEPALDMEERCLYVGRPDEAVFAEIADRRSLEGERMIELHRRYSQRYLDKLRSNRLVPLPGVRKGLEFLRARFPLALVTGSTQEQAELVLERLRLHNELWRRIITADNVDQGKPAPEPYLAAARILDVPIHQCLVVEDSEPGVLAGRAAGAAVLHVGPFHPQVSWIADRQIARLDRIDDMLMADLWLHRPLPQRPAGAVLAEIGALVHETGIAARLGECLSEANDLWTAFQRAAEGPVPELSATGDLLWRLFVCGEEIDVHSAQEALSELIDSGLVEAELIERLDCRLVARLRLLAVGDLLILKEPPRTLPNRRFLSAETYLERSSLEFRNQVISALSREGNSPGQILELGTGTGLILCELLRRYTDSTGIGTDLSGRAVHLARANAALNGVADRMEVMDGDLFAPVAGREPFDLVLFHPPYRIMPPEVPYPDPLSRYGTGPDGLGVVRRCLGGMAGFLAPHGRGLMLLELPRCVKDPSYFERQLRAVAEGLQLRFHPVGDPVPVAKMARLGAVKCLQGEAGEHEERLLEAYATIGADTLVPVLVEARL